MKRMLKRKIHPELDDKIHKSDRQKPAAGAIGLMITNGEQAAASNEAVSLLPIQGINLLSFSCLSILHVKYYNVPRMSFIWVVKETSNTLILVKKIRYIIELPLIQT